MEKEDLYGNFEKKVQFTDSDKRYADLRLQLHFDGLRQGEFFRGLDKFGLNPEELEDIFDMIEKEQDSV